jgi:predicted phosphoribosyltransferase
MPHRLFRDRRDAGQVLAGLLEQYRDRGDVIVVGLPRGGVPVAYEVATSLGARLDVFVVRKLGVPGREELAMGAIASGGVTVINDDVVRGLRIPPEAIEQVAEREGRELLRREQAYREGRPFLQVVGKVVIVVDDGLATGSSMRAAVEALRRLRPARIVVAVPAAPESTCRELGALADQVVCATTPSPARSGSGTGAPTGTGNGGTAPGAGPRSRSPRSGGSPVPWPGPPAEGPP